MSGDPAPPLVSVIIPTYNRKVFLLEALDSIARQSLPFDRFEVIVVDDGGQDGTEEIQNRHFPYHLRYIRQENQGDAAARNTGAIASSAEILVSLDDDMVLEQDYLACLVAEIIGAQKRIAAGAWYLWLKDANPLGDPERFDETAIRKGSFEIPFTEVNTHSLAIRREDFTALGMMQDLGFPGSSMWTDVDLAYRAYRDDFQFIRVGDAIVWHRDYVFRSLENQKKRMREAAFRSVILFRRHPGLIRFLPMFEDKTPIDRKLDPPGLIYRKLARRMNATPPVLWMLEKAHQVLHKGKFSRQFSILLERWIVGGYIAQGYQFGLKELVEFTSTPQSGGQDGFQREKDTSDRSPSRR